jgi:hypothetical protein
LHTEENRGAAVPAAPAAAGCAAAEAAGCAAAEAAACAAAEAAAIAEIASTAKWAAAAADSQLPFCIPSDTV